MKKRVVYTICLCCSVLIGCSVRENSFSATTALATNQSSESEAMDEMVYREPVRPGVRSIDYFLPFNHSEIRTKPITHVMIHFISNAEKNPKDPFNVKDVRDIFLEYGLSAHYMIDRSGTIYQLVSEDRVAYHAGKGSIPGLPDYDNRMNHFSIGIELLAIGTKDEMKGILTVGKFEEIDPTLLGYTDAQYEALHQLLNDILARNHAILRDRRHVIGHDEYAPDRKTDPGSLFDWTKLGF
ncbi:N-acetylmuramoyl-L-alanine amidase [Fredinandcohnia humi]